MDQTENLAVTTGFKWNALATCTFEHTARVLN